MANYETTMSALIGNLKRICAAETQTGGDLAKIKLVKRGVLPPRVQYPVLTFLPSTERIDTYVSSGHLKVRRTVDVFLLGSPQSPELLWDLQDTMDVVQELLRTNRQVPDESGNPTALDSILSSIDMDMNTVGLKFSASYVSYDRLPSTTVDRTVNDNPTPRDLRDQIYNHLMSLKPTTLSGVRSIFRESWDQASRATFPAVVVSLDDHSSSENISGLETITASFAIDVYSLIQGAADETLITHMNLMQAVKTAALGRPTWNSRAQRTHMKGIEYGTMMDEDEALYQSSFYADVISCKY